MRGLAFRRQQRRRIRNRRLRYLRWSWGDRWPVSTRVAGQHTNTNVLCSCWMCGNPRRYFGEVTRQELRAPVCQLEAQEG